MRSDFSLKTVSHVHRTIKCQQPRLWSQRDAKVNGSRNGGTPVTIAVTIV